MTVRARKHKCIITSGSWSVCHGCNDISVYPRAVTRAQDDEARSQLALFDSPVAWMLNGQHMYSH